MKDMRGVVFGLLRLLPLLCGVLLVCGCASGPETAPINQPDEGEKWFMHARPDEVTDKEIDGLYFVLPADWTFWTKEDILFTGSAPDYQQPGGSGRIGIVYGPYEPDAEKYFINVQKNLIEKWGPVQAKQRLEHPLGEALWMRFNLKDPDTHRHPEVYHLFSHRYKFNLTLTGIAFSDEQDGTTVLNRVFRSLKLE